MIIGAQKGGTSALFEILKQHPHLAAASKKEIHYFDNDEWYEEGNIHEYNSHFLLPHEGPLRAKAFEATPIYIFHPLIAERLHRYNPKLKLIVSLREPAERAFSAWTMYHHHFSTGKYQYLHDPRPFDVAVNEELEILEQTSFWENKIAYVKRGIYHSQIEEYLKYFPKEQMLFIESEMIKDSFSQVSFDIQAFLGVPKYSLLLKKSNLRQTDEQEKYETTLKELMEFYSPYNEELFELIGQKFNW
ncbi:MAG: sulfotransferase domain-containing protein [Bacteroidota bacterium]